MDSAQSAWPEQAFDVGADGFPRPGQVIRYFRRMRLKANGKPWTQRDLAQVLDKQELAVREMELRDSGLHDIAARRFLATLFDIPPVLLGLAELPAKPNKANSATWWVQQGYAAFDIGVVGFPRPGQVIRYFRRRKLKANGKPWTQRDLAEVLGKQELSIRDMELRDTGLNNISRRRFLAQLFDIPPLLLGLAATPPSYHGQPTRGTSSTPKMKSPSAPVDLESVREQLTWFWTNIVEHPQDVLQLIESLLKQLYTCYPTAAPAEQGEILASLCELHIHAANLLRDRGKSLKSLEHLKQTEDLNVLLKADELQADVLYRRGGLYPEKGNLTLALQNYYTAGKLLSTISPPLQAALLLETALCEAKIASLPQQLALLKKLDRAGHIIRVEHTETGRERYPYLNVDLERYHLDRSATLLTLGMPKEAWQELALLSSTHLKGRRKAYYVILQAQACVALKEYQQAAWLAEEALSLVRMMHSRVNFERIQVLYNQLQQSSFQHNPEVERLEYLLFYNEA